MSPPITVIIATTRPWPWADLCVRVALPQVRAVGGELILADGDGAGFDPIVDPDVVWFKRPGADRMELHAEAIPMARGDVVVITEDHIRPPEGWCDAILVAHDERPDVDLIVGAVRNGSERTAFERASFLISSAAYLPPLTSVPDRAPPFSTMTIKRRAIPSRLSPGEWEFGWSVDQWRRGSMAVDDRVVVEHVQDVSRLGSLALHFHNGRIHGGRLRETRATEQKVIRRTLRLVPQLEADVRHALAARPPARYPLRDRVATTLLACAHTLGALVGFKTGHGGSARKVT